MPWKDTQLGNQTELASDSPVFTSYYLGNLGTFLTSLSLTFLAVKHRD